MALRTKIYYAEQVLEQLKLPLRNRDDKVDIREVYVAMDNWINEKAKEGFIENMRLMNSMVDEQYITTFENLTITDNGKQPSVLTLPSNYVALPNNQGIQDVYFMNDSTKKKYFDPVLITNFRDIAGYRSQMAFNNQGRLSVAPKDGNLVFNIGGVGATYGNAAVRLVIKSAFDISNDAQYPIPADQAAQMVIDVTTYFLGRPNTAAANLRNNLDAHESQPNR